jgi:hypothetical protein
MARSIELRPMQEIVDKIRQEARAQAESVAKGIVDEAEERIGRLESTRRGLAMLDCSGFDLQLREYQTGASIEVDLGFFPLTRGGNRRLAEQLRRVRIALDCRLAYHGKDDGDPRRGTVRFHFRPVDFPGVTVRYERKIPKGSKCKWVTRRSTYRTLICQS